MVVGERSLVNRGQGVGGVNRLGGQFIRLEEIKNGPILLEV